MSSTDHPISYVVDSIVLDMFVEGDTQKEVAISQTCTRPWLTVCIEPISLTLLAAVLSLDPPGSAVMQSLLYQALLPSKDHPYGRRPDILWVERASLFIVLHHQEIFQHLLIALERTPLLREKVSERIFASLSRCLQTHSSRFHEACEEKEGKALPHISLFQLETICTQWTKSYSRSLHDQQKQEYLDSCQTRWRTSPVTPGELDLLLSWAM